MKAMRGVSVALLALASSGCSILFQGSPPPVQTYFLRADDAPAADPVPLHVSLRVMHPAADPGLDTSRIVLLQSHHRMGFYAGSQWPATLPDLVEALAVETLDASGAWVSIEDSSSPFPSDYVLQITIRRFEADYASSASASLPRVHVVLGCILAHGDTVIASYLAQGTATPAANRLADIVAAFQSASNQALRTLSDRALAAVRADTHRPG